MSADALFVICEILVKYLYTMHVCDLSL